MKILFKILLIFIIIFQISCSKKNIEISEIKETDIELQMIQLYEEGYDELEGGDVFYATKKFNEAELIFPQSKWAPRAALMAAYGYYSQDYYFDAIYEAERYLKKYPNHEDHDYAHFLLAMCYYENIVDVKRDLDPLLKAKKQFEIIIEKYPETDFAMDAKFKIELINDRLAGKEMFIAKHYLKSKKWIPAINRYKIVVEDYETTIFIEEALHRLVELNYRIGLIEESMKYAELLGYNYQSSDWYKSSYKVFNNNYEYNEKKEAKLRKKEKRKIFTKFKRKFKTIFD